MHWWDKLLEFISGIGTGLVNMFSYFKGVFCWLRDHVLAAIFIAVAIVATVFRFIIAQLAGAYETFRSFVHGVSDPTALETAMLELNEILERVNCVLPIGIIVTAAVGVSLFWVAWAGYKFIKSWIPTLSGT